MEHEIQTSSATCRRPLNANWRFREAQWHDKSRNTRLPWQPAEVPGQVHLDLMRAGAIPNPFFRLNERTVQWVDETDWTYETTFHLDEPPAPTTYLLFEGLDTVAEIILNGEQIGVTDNMFIPHEFEVGGRLRFGAGETGDNTLQITFRSALRVGNERHTEWVDGGSETMPYPGSAWGPRSFVRKAQYMYGWDWGPELISCGIWRPVALVSVPVARLLDWSHDVEFQDDGGAAVSITAFVERPKNSVKTPIEFTLELTEVGSDAEDFDDALPDPISIPIPAGEGRIEVHATLTIAHARRWWPNRHNATGEPVHPALYTLEMGISHEDAAIDQRTARIGLRTIELIREPDPTSAGESFKFRVNGKDIFIKGANWIPADSFLSRIHNDSTQSSDPPAEADTRVYETLWMACDAGYNMLRVWGGGIYESEHFYELCDAHGILVWQDFAYGCAYYPDTGRYVEAARCEAVAAIRRLRTHACLALWCGNNENQLMHHDKWVGESRPSRLLGDHLYEKVLGDAVLAEDKQTPYWPGSPYGGNSPNAGDSGDKHNWNVWHGVGDWTYYTEDSSRFVSEFGFSASCGLAAWENCLDTADKHPMSQAVRWHDKTRRGYENYIKLIAIHYPTPQTLEDLVYYSQLNQADALSHGIEHYRRTKGYCWGTLFWQINDCWPVQSWSVIDAAGEPKASYYASKRFYAPVLLSLAHTGDSVEVHVTNDRLAPVSGRITLELTTFDGEILAAAEYEANVAANATAQIATFDSAAARGREREVFLQARLALMDGTASAPDFHFFAEPKDLRLTDPGLTVTADDEDAETMVLTLTTARLAAGIWLSIGDTEAWGDRVEWEDNYFHLAPGATRSLFVSKTEQLRDVNQLLGRLRIRTL